MAKTVVRIGKNHYIFVLGWCLICLNFAMPSTAMILRVPDEYPTIQVALDSSSVYDTILCNPGTYLCSFRIRQNIAFASTWVINNDSSVISATRFIPESQRMFLADSQQISFLGISLEANTVPYDSGKILIGSSTTAVFNHCNFSGTFDTVRFFSTGTIHLSGSNNSVKMVGCRVVFDDIAATPFIMSDSVQIDSSSFKGRTNSERYREIMPFVRTGFFQMSDCFVDIRGEGIDSYQQGVIERTIFKRGDNLLIAMGGSSTLPRTIRDCVFDSCDGGLPSDRGFLLISLSSRNAIPLMENCVFRDCRTNIAQSLLKARYSIDIRNSRFIRCNGYRSVILASIGRIDSTDFLDCSSPIFAHLTDQNGDSLYITNTDFSSTGIFDFSSYHFTNPYALNCYWGDPSGPNHPNNPGGLGLTIPSYVQFLPFRTTPVFPNSGLNDPPHSSLPSQFSLHPNYPNPFNSSTTIKYSIAKTSKVDLKIFDLTGREVATLVDFHQNPGEYTFKFDGSTLAAGTYFVRLQAGDYSRTQKIVLLK